MPCQYYTPEEERQISKRRYKEELDRLTHENDMLRDALLAAVEGEDIDPAVLKKINADQVKHRKEDLARLKKTFTANRDAERLGLVMLADPKKPLAPQLGFYPNEF